jgi:hypothetical protein
MSPHLNSEVDHAFERLLDDWNRAQKQLIDKWPGGADRAMGREDLRLEWLERFHAARRLERRLYEGDDDR